MYEKLINWLEQQSKPCFYKEHFGFECLGCGIQRSMIELLKGHFIESFRLFPALIPLIILFTVLLFHLKFRLKNGSQILTTLFILNVLLIIGNFILKQTLN